VGGLGSTLAFTAPMVVERRRSVDLASLETILEYD
jgi:hypothetical protein